MPDVNDIKARNEEVRNLIGDDRIPDALKRLMDYAQDFSGDRDGVNQATVIKASVTFLERSYKSGEIPYDEFDRARTKKLYAALDLIDTILLAKAS